MSGRKRKAGTSGGGGGGSRRNGGGDAAAAELCMNPACAEIRDYYEKFRQLLQKVVDESRANKARAYELQIRVEEVSICLSIWKHFSRHFLRPLWRVKLQPLPAAAPSASLHTKRNGFRTADAGQAPAPQVQQLSDEEAQPLMAAASEPSPPPSPPASVSSEPSPPPVRRRKSRHEFSDTGSDEGGSGAGDDDSDGGPATAAVEVDSHDAMASEVSGGVADDAGGSAPKAKRGRAGRGAGGAEAPAAAGALGGASSAAVLSKAPAPVLSAGSLAAWSKPANLPSFLRESPKPVQQEPPPPQQQLPPEKKKRGRAAKRPAPPSPRPTPIDANGGGGGSDVQQPKQRRRRITGSHTIAAEAPAAAAAEFEDVGDGGAASKHSIATKENLIAAVRRADSASAQAIGAAVHAVSHGHADWLEAAYALWHPEVDAPPPRHALVEALLTQVTRRRSIGVRTDARRLQRNVSAVDALASLTLALSTEECGQADLMDAARSRAEEALFALLASVHFSGAAPAVGAAAAQLKGPDTAPNPSKPNTSAAPGSSADEDASDTSLSEPEHDADDEAETATAENTQRSHKRNGLSDQVMEAQALLTRLAVEMAPAPHPQLLLAVIDGWADVAERCLPGDQESDLLTAPGLFGLVLAAALASSPKRRDQDDAMTTRIRAAFAVPESLVALGPSTTSTSSDGDDASGTGSADTAASLLLQRIVDSLANAQACHSSDGGAACKLCAAAAAARGGGDHSSSSSNGGGSSKGHDRWRTAHTAIEHLAKCQRPGWLQRKYWLSGGALPSVLRGGGGGGGSGDGGGDGSSSGGSSGARCEAARALAAHALAACARAALLTEAPTYHQERITRFNKNEPKVEFGRAAAELLAAVDAVKAALETAAADSNAPAEVRAAAVAARAALLCGEPDVQGVQAALSKAGGVEAARAGRMDTAALRGIVRHAGLPCAHVINLARRPER
ncbi:hypothetical protein JKP88DRAFT_243096 [Tribonema minus]|uniref:Uncharacterized protein n=1 Tax=Tribonema minus TaxID=303371 RepID=A0A835ZH26_9STRA|nr:hypothetical protein JKP88DRAFT_243096 [Tribonema minus]